MSRFTRVSTALALAISVFALPLALNECSATCQLHRSASDTSDPVCHHESPFTAKIGQSPMPCGHDHDGIATVSATQPQSARAFPALVALACDRMPSIAAFVPAHRVSAFASPPHDLLAFRLSVSLRI